MLVISYFVDDISQLVEEINSQIALQSRIMLSPNFLQGTNFIRK